MTRITKNRAVAQTQESAHEAKIIQMPTNEQPAKVKTEKLLDGLWQFAHATLWFGEKFNKAEITHFKKLIEAHFQKNKSPQQNFKELVQRICLAKRYADYSKDKKLAQAGDWLKIGNPEGLSGTLIPYEEIKFLRQYESDCETGIQVLANGLLLYMGSPFYFKTCVNSLSRLNESALIQFFYNTIINLQYYCV